MSVPNIETLPWLQVAPKDFPIQLRRLESEGQLDVSTLLEFSNYGLDLNKLTTLDGALQRQLARDLDVTPPRIKLAVLADGMLDLCAPAIRATALRFGILAELYLPPFGQGFAEALNPHSDLANFQADAALIAQDYRLQGFATSHLNPTDAVHAVDVALAQTRQQVQRLHSIGIRSIILQTLAIPSETWCGHLDMQLPGSTASQIRAYNQRLFELADEVSAVILDAESLSSSVGRWRWFDQTHWHRAKLTFGMNVLPLYADHVARILAAMRGKSRKCLVLDLDNTLWGGVVGDDGIHGIEVGQGSADGEAFVAFQKYALQLKQRGIILAVCSKNENHIAASVFEDHPDMLLRHDDFAMFVANWTDKATNLKHIAKSLNIGTDALVFADDNPAERARVRQMLREVAVPELPDEPALFPVWLSHAGYFETVAVSPDDAQRAQQYAANARRTVELEKLGNYDEYLQSLEMVCSFKEFDEMGRSRIAQLINKSNQFNLTTRRYTEAEVAALEDDPNLFALQIRLSDKFGDNGMISVVIFRKCDQEWRCDTWLMSCRVLERRVEEAALAVVAKAALGDGINRLVGEYIPTARNQIVREHFSELGFVLQEPTGVDDSTTWVLDLSKYSAPVLPMTIINQIHANNHDDIKPAHA